MNVLVTAGPTREAIDPVRFLSNRSSGKMGYAMAAAALDAGHAVRLISGPVALEPPPGAAIIRIISAAEMLAAVEEHLAWCNLFVMAAAVADWRPKHPAAQKIKKTDGPPCIEWEATPDILRRVASRKKGRQVFCGFAAETGPLAREAKRKLREKNLDAIAANSVQQSDRGFESDRNALTVFCEDGRSIRIPLSAKSACARRLLCVLEDIAEKK